jgi:hypothetical protein
MKTGEAIMNAWWMKALPRLSLIGKIKPAGSKTLKSQRHTSP